jgi:hypothetical protein
MPDATESWLQIPGFEGIYAVSDLGNVMSMNYGNRGFQRLLVPVLKRGYPCVWLSKNKHQKIYSVHRLVMLAFVGPCPIGREVNHISGIKSDGRLLNLEYVTHSENKLHAYRIGLQKPAVHTNWNPRHGVNHRNAKLTLEQIGSIQDKLAQGMTQREVAVEFGVNPSNISRIANGKRWIRSRTVLQ